jgi:CPA2 family monovalent cation:H+ antiporter-2
VVIVGHGVTGRVLAEALAACGLKSIGLELNADTVREARAKGVSVYYGDATSAEALHHAHLENARALVLVINDPSAAQRVIDTAKQVAPHVPILLRTRYLAEKPMLLGLGATDVVAEEVEGAVELLVRLLRWLQLPRNVIEQRVRETRDSTQTSERKLTIPRRTLGEMEALADLKLESFALPEGAPGVGQSAVSLNLRKQTGALIIALKRGATLVEQPDPTQPFQAGDVLFLVGSGAAIRAASAVLQPAPRVTSLEP